ncbi:hypothetical protein MKZ38_004124 [Zalerion maritima]|uniref:Uncharacterized protein n=1 Tax=Zalerion maritima TaxID=339359 RepID=A0AAD5WR95_9PEZI|nr:hypothetical protein MKZ38_004124 [Zalerion maritima]
MESRKRENDARPSTRDAAIGLASEMTSFFHHWQILGSRDQRGNSPLFFLAAPRADDRTTSSLQLRGVCIGRCLGRSYSSQHLVSLFGSVGAFQSAAAAGDWRNLHLQGWERPIGSHWLGRDRQLKRCRTGTPPPPAGARHPAKPTKLLLMFFLKMDGESGGGREGEPPAAGAKTAVRLRVLQ